MPELREYAKDHEEISFGVKVRGEEGTRYPSQPDLAPPVQNIRSPVC